MLGSSDPGWDRRLLRPGVAVYTCYRTPQGDDRPAIRTEACLTYVRKHGLIDERSRARQYLELVDAKPENRPILKEIVLAAGRGEFGLVLIHSLQSISSGDPADGLEIVRVIEATGTAFRSVHDPWIDSSIPGAGAVRSALDWAFKAKATGHAERVRQGIARSRADARGRGENPAWGRARGATLSTDTALVSEIVRLRDSGLSLKETGKAVGKPKTTVARLEDIGRGAGEGHARHAHADVADPE